MIMPSDKDYQETKLIKQDRKQLINPFRELSNWINEEFQVNVLNIYYDLIQPNDRPRLNIIFEYRNDESKFRTHPNGNYDAKKQKVIAEKFKEIICKDTCQPNGLGKYTSEYDSKNIWVIFSSFEPVALIEANESIPEEKIKGLKDEISDKNMWEISRCFAGVTFFYYTDEQVKECEKKGTKNKLTDAYYKLLKLYDEFDYIKKENFTINIDSKQNFDENYESSWFYYYR